MASEDILLIKGERVGNYLPFWKMSAIKVKVNTFDTELEFTVQKKTKGKALFDQVIQTTGIREVRKEQPPSKLSSNCLKHICWFLKVWYFGLEFTTSTEKKAWLNLEKKIAKQNVKAEAVLKFDFKFKYYPENVEDVIQEQTLKLFYLQVSHKHNLSKS